MNIETLEGGGALSCGCIETDDPTVFEATSRPWEVLSEPLSSRAFHNRKHYLATESVMLYREHFSTPMRLRGMSPPGKLVVGIPLQHGERTRHWGCSPQPAEIVMRHPGVLDSVVDAGDAHFVLLIDIEFLRRNLGDASTAILETADQRLHLGAEPEEIAAFSAWLNATLIAAGPRARRAPSGEMRHKTIRKARLNPTKTEQLVNRLEQEIPHRLLELCQGPRRQIPRPRVAASRARMVNRALEYLRESDPVMPTVGELCRVTGAKQRTLEYAFDERFGLSPLRFIRVHRLHQARHQLAAAAPRSVRVSQVALNLGFRHMSRFSQDYKELFGELPSQTLERKVHDVSAAPLICSSPSITNRPPRYQSRDQSCNMAVAA